MKQCNVCSQMFNIKQIEFNIKLTAFFENVWMKSLKFRLNLVKPCEWFIVLHFNEDMSPLIEQNWTFQRAIPLVDKLYSRLYSHVVPVLM